MELAEDRTKFRAFIIMMFNSWVLLPHY